MLNGHVKENLTSDLAYPRMEKTVPQFLTIDEYNRILEHGTDNIDTERGLRNLIILLLLGMLGLRTGAIIGLNYQDVNLVAGLLWVREKGGICRTVVMPKVLCSLLQAYTVDRPWRRGPLLLSKRKRRFSLRSLQVMFAEMMDAVGIDKHLHAHLFRHTAGAHLNKVAGTSICQYVLGHARRKNTMKYAHLNPDHYAVYMRCHPFVKEAL
jgi:integrase/recombinase XerC